ncbi:MAG: RNA polymerase sigma factor SigZ [Pirellulales bacterium]
MLLKAMKDAIATENVWHALSAELHGFLRSRVPSDSDADDLLQDVFVRVYENIGSLRQAGRVESWVYQIARNAVSDFYRRRTPRAGNTVEDVVEPQVEGDGERNQNRAVGAWLSLMIDVLPPTLRDAVRMYEIEGLSQSEIASCLGISLSGAKSRVQRGRRRLEELLQGSCQLERDRRGNVIACKPANDTGCAQVSCDCDEGSLG